MPYAASHYLLTLAGTRTSEGATEDWQFGLRISENQSATPTQMTDRLNDYHADLLAYWGQIRSYWPSTAKLSYAKLARIGTDGKYLSDAVVKDYVTGNITGAATQAAMPPSVAVAVTLLTDSNRGLGHMGRFYLPAPSSNSLDIDGSLSIETADVVKNATVTFLNNINNLTGSDAGDNFGEVIVASRVRDGAEKVVTGIKVGLRFDVQRRRAEKIPEMYREALNTIS